MWLTKEHRGAYGVVLTMLINAGVANPSYGTAHYGDEASYYALLDALMGWRNMRC